MNGAANTPNLPTLSARELTDRTGCNPSFAAYVAPLAQAAIQGYCAATYWGTRNLAMHNAIVPGAEAATERAVRVWENNTRGVQRGMLETMIGAAVDEYTNGPW